MPTTYIRRRQLKGKKSFILYKTMHKERSYL